MIWAIKNDSWRYEAVEIVKETAKTATYKHAHWGDTRTDLNKLFDWRGSEAEARLLSERLTSAKAERDRRVNAASDWFRKERDRILASGTEARRAETPQDGSVHDGPTSQSEGTPNLNSASPKGPSTSGEG